MNEQTLKLLRDIVEQDEFTHGDDDSTAVKQAYAILNSWRARAAAVLINHPSSLRTLGVDHLGPALAELATRA